MSPLAPVLPSWRDTATKRSILEFLGDVTDPASPAFVPVVDRVAVFDNDGTLSCEMPLYTQLAFALDRSAHLGEPMTVEDLHAGGIGAVLQLVKLTHGGITTDEFERVCRDWIARARHPERRRPYTAMVFQPMVELLDLLERHEFTCWVFSGGGTDFMRTWAGDVFGLAPHRLIGSVGATELQAGPDGPELVKGTDVEVVNDGARKPVSIHGHVGQRPVLAAGNTDGDLPMLQWTATNTYRTLQLVVSHTDAEREYAYDHDPILGAGTDLVRAAAADQGWSVVDVAADWATVFPAE
jgi:hypothetical protein